MRSTSCGFKQKGNDHLLKVLRYVFTVITFLFASYGVFTEDYKFADIMLLFLGLTMLVMGIEELQKGQKGVGWLLLAVFLFSIFVSIKGLLLS
ncbi:YczI family protein [Cytobacillus massiliigabonensis]|uniref:YczI family protein n=1 Tax=Cytobacillus massiliigabonensis TaxID=1871011 RepID=UPI000C820AF7